MKMKLVLCGIVCLLVSETYTQGFSNNFNGFGNGPQPGVAQNHNSHLHAPQQVSNPFRRQTNDGFKQKQPQQQQQPHSHHQHSNNNQQQYFIQQAQSIEVPFNQKNTLINQRPPAQARFPVPNQFAPPQPKSNPVFQRSLENQLRIPQSPYQSLPSTQISNVLPKDQDFHSQNFLTLRNHVQNAGPTQQLPQRTQQQQFLQPQTQQQQIQPKPQQQPQFLQSQPQQQPIQPKTQQQFIPPQPQQQQIQPQTQQQQFFQSAPQFSPKPKQSQQQLQSQQSSFNFQNIPLTSAGQFNFQQPTQQQQTFQKLPQIVQQQQFQPALQPTPQALPQIQSSPSFNENIQKFQAVPNFQQSQFIQPSLQQFQTAPQIGQHQQSFTQPQIQFQQPQPQFTTTPQLGHNPDQEYKQKLIQKHEQFVQKQYEKNQNKAQQLHQQFVQKQHQIKQQGPPTIRFPIPTIGGQTQSRPVLPTETHLFENAIKKYQEEHPTTTTTTPAPVPQTTLTYTNIFQNHPNPNAPPKPGKTFSNDEVLKQLKAALSENPQAGLGNKTFDAMDLVLANGQKVQVIRTSDPNLIKGQKTISQSQLESLQSGKTSDIKFENLAPESKKDFVLSNGNKVQIVRAPNPDDIVGTASVPAGLAGGLDLSSLANLYGGGSTSGSSPSGNSISSAVIQSDSDQPPTIEELAKRGLIPDGYEIDGLSSKSKPKPKPTAPAKKKATYVYLEEQNDGSFKIQGVKANGEKETKTTGSEVESILNRIRSGEIKLPPTVKKLTLPNDEEVYIDAIVNGGAIVSSPTMGTTTTTTPRPFTTTRRPHVVRSSYSPTPTTGAPVYSYRTSGHVAAASTTYQTTALPRSSPQYISPSTYRPVTEKLTATPTPAPLPEPDLSLDPTENLIQIFKSKELFAMAKYLRQSGLDKILNETGPYTVFVPTDKAFKNLLVQLGGPERAEEKFKVNPRLLSGLLLHHVIPGSFEISDLQDEMTGVSLAGTQLRVNQYTMHDQEWNDVTITTINGAMVLNDRKDIKIPQGIAHAVDRVMFPLPVGDLLQTLQSDRDSRFTTFLKIVNAAEYNEKLQSKGVKTYTVFAPTEKAFEELEAGVVSKLTTEKDAALEFIEKHVVQGTLFSAGMRFYQVKDSLANGNSVILQKTSSGKIKVNDAHMVSSNIPATNGVIHAIDGLL